MYKKIYATICFATFLSLAVTFLAVTALTYTSKSSDFKNSVRQMAYMAEQFLNENPGEIPQSDARHDWRISIIDQSGNVVYDTSNAAGDHSNRPEIAMANQNNIGEAARYSQTVKSKVYYCAIKLNDGRIVRVSRNFSEVWKDFFAFALPAFIIVFLVYLLSMIIAVKAAAGIVRPVGELADGRAEYSELSAAADKINTQTKKIQGQKSRLSAQKLQLKFIAKSMNEGLLVLDRSANVVLINEKCEQIFKINGEKNKNFFDVSKNDALKNDFECVMKNEAKTSVLKIDEKMYEVLFSPVTEDGGGCIGAVMIFVDIDDKYKAETVRREFCANVSHELRTPLTSILGYLQLINNGMVKEDAEREFTQKAETETRRMIELVKDITELSKLDEGGGFETEKEKVALFKTAKETAEQIKDIAGKKNVSVTVSGEEFFVWANRSQIKEMMYNLLENAVKYNKENGSVIINVYPNGFYVADSGIGIDKADYERIFERFYRADKSRSKKIGGSGLGLSIVKHIAMLNGAKISVDEGIDGGSRFNVWFGGDKK